MAHYSDEPNVEVIVDRRAQGGAPGTHDPMTDRRRLRPKGSFPPIDAPGFVNGILGAAEREQVAS